MSKLKVFKLGYNGKILGFRVAVKSNILNGVFDLTTEEAKEIGVDKFYSEKVINLIPQGNLLVSKQEIEQNIIIKDIKGNEAKLKEVINSLSTAKKDKPNKAYEDFAVEKLCTKYIGLGVKQYSAIQYIGVNIYSDIKAHLVNCGYNGNSDIVNKIKDKIDIFFKRRGFEGCDMQGFEDEMSGDEVLDHVFLLVGNSDYVYIKQVADVKNKKAI